MVIQVRVSADGRALAVDLASSSGSPSLDRVALSGVKRARFTPAMRGATPVESTMSVSVVFRLDN